MREVVASPNRQPEEPPATIEPSTPVDTEDDAILQFEFESKGQPAEPTRVTPFPVLVHASAPVAEKPEKVTVEVVTPPKERGNWRNAVPALLVAVLLAQGALLAYWMVSRRSPTPSIPVTGNVTITSEPSGSAVVIDGSARGQTPLTIALSSGAHSLVIGSGEVARSQTVNVTGGGESSVHVQLPETTTATSPAVVATGTLQIATEPPGARVTVDGKAHGTAPITIADLTAGDHAVTVRAGEGDAIRRTVTVQQGATASLIITMPAAGGASGWLAVSSEVALQVREKGELLGTTEMPRILLPAGAHDIELVNTSLSYRVTRSLTISAGQTERVAVAHPRGTLSINALPWAEVWIDGERAGETPIGNYSIPIGTHELVFRNPEFGEQHKTVIVGAQGPARVGVDMKKP